MKKFLVPASLCAALLSVSAPFSPAFAADEAVNAAPSTSAASTGTAATSTPSTTTSVLTADAVQEAFVRVSNRVRPSVVSIQASRNPRGAAKDKAKPGDKSAPGGDEEEAEEEEDGDGPNPFGMPFAFGPRDPRERPRALGTGMIISREGHILTNYHVVRGAAFIRVLFDADSETPDNPAAQLVGYDEEADLAVLKLARPKENLQPVEFANSDSVRIGEWALAVGAPFEQAQSVTVGVISAKARHLEGKEGISLQDYIQTDASINPGNSGGPLFNLDGKVIGINTAILSPSRFNVGIGFSVPSNTVRALMPTLLSGQPVERGFIGISYMKLNPGVAKEFGIESGMHIGALASDEKTGEPIGPAKAAGLKVDDIITHVDGKPVGSVEEFRRLISGLRPGTSLALRVARPGEGVALETRDVSLKLGTRSAKKLVFPALQIEAGASSLGLQVQDASKLSTDEREVLRLKNATRGVIVTDVVPGSPADEGEVRRGYRVVRARVNGGAWQAVSSKAAFEKLQALLAPGSRLLMQVRDKDDISAYTLVVAPGKSAGNVS